MKLYKKILIGGLMLASIGAKSQGFTTNNAAGSGLLLDANGNNFVMKGMNVPLDWYRTLVNGSIDDVRRNTNSNCLRIVMTVNTPDNVWQTAVQNCIDNDMIPMVELHDVTGNTDEDELIRMGRYWASKASYLTRPEIARYILINLCNEWGTWQTATSNGAAWQRASVAAIRLMREANIKTTIVVDAVGYGQDVDEARNLRALGRAMQQSDAGFLGGQANLLFSIHMYCEWAIGRDNIDIVGTIKSMGIPVIVGEFGYQHGEGNGICNIDEQAIMDACQRHGVGWLAWSQKGNGSGVEYLDLCNDWECTSLSGWGNTVINGRNGTKTAVTASVFTGAGPTPVKRYGNNVALNKTVTVSSTESGQGNVAANAVDGNATTRWASVSADPQSIQIDLGRTHVIDTIVLRWEAAYGSAYRIETSTNGTVWTQRSSTTTGNGGVDEIPLSNITTRYVRLTGTTRATTFGYSLYEFEVYGEAVYGTNVALNKPVTVTSTEAGSNHVAANLTDASKTTRWASASLDNQSAIIDLQSSFDIDDIVINWEAAYAEAYSVQVSTDQTNWTTVSTTTTGNGGIDAIENLTNNARYVRINLTKRATSFGFSMFDVAVYGTPGITTGIEEGSILENMVYPNPFQDKINLNMSSDAEIQLTDINGAILYNGFGREIETSSYPRGMYVLKIRQNGSSRVFKMTKN